MPFDHTTGRLTKDLETEWDAASPHFAGGAVPTVLRGHRPRPLLRLGDEQARGETRID
ncbi:protein of unknown function [Candidatus Nitrospira inopinata]|uniref:Uncharacterized protein n=1 Tax=Candidatus Nitrospira inopinata TaxID=1715989 RepID=A0A0S4KS51_9BACT|nr:protein of unknown function [Candidatus Nitrospira inopinata]